MEKSYKQYLNKINTFIFDIDGVLTDGTIQVTTQGELYRTMHTKDGFALKTAIDKGYYICIISGGSNEGVRKRLEGLGIETIFLGAHNKLDILEQYCKSLAIAKHTILYMGDDIPDLEVMKRVGLACCPQDAVPEIKAISNYISHKKGGQGCVRDVIEQVLKVQDNWVGSQSTSASYD